jgi:diguanylate cyclase (GGDEF)-like protein
VLVAVSQALKGAVRQVDVVARFGGEEFVVVAPQAEPREAPNLAERLRRAAAAARVELEGERAVRVTVSCGVATMSGSLLDSPSTLLACADRALYRAKQLGRDRTQVYTEELSAPSLVAPAPVESAH